MESGEKDLESWVFCALRQHQVIRRNGLERPLLLRPRMPRICQLIQNIMTAMREPLRSMRRDLSAMAATLLQRGRCRGARPCYFHFAAGPPAALK
jgi:hypothetical protein